MLPRRTLRASFVVTVASGALVGLGCSSTINPTPDGQVQGDANPPFDVQPIDIINPPFDGPPFQVDVPDAALASCPATAPMSGSACDPSLGRVCTYGECFGWPTTEARCEAGVWRVLASECNPPPPEECPTAMPRPGDACENPSLSCNWGSCPPSNVTAGRCVDGRWLLVATPCNVPSPPDAGPDVDRGFPNPPPPDAGPRPDA